MKNHEEWEPIPQRRSPKFGERIEEQQLEIPVPEPLEPEAPEYHNPSPAYEVGEGIDITPVDESGTVEEEEDEEE